MTRVLIADIYYAQRVRLTPEQMGLESFPDFETLPVEEWADLSQKAERYILDHYDNLDSVRLNADKIALNEVDIWTNEDLFDGED